MGKDIGMRKVKYFVANSLDGFISQADGSVDWLFMDQDYGMSDFFASVDVAAMGRKTYDKIQELARTSILARYQRVCVFANPAVWNGEKDDISERADWFMA